MQCSSSWIQDLPGHGLNLPGRSWPTAPPDLPATVCGPVSQSTGMAHGVTGPGSRERPGPAAPGSERGGLRRRSGARALVPRGGELARARNVTLQLPPGRGRLVVLDRAHDLVVLDRVLLEHTRALAMR